MSELKRDVIYVDLDALLDTRLGTLATVNDDFAVNAMKADYFKRESDTFPDMDLETFKEAYAQRDVAVLRRSVLTNVIYLLVSFVKSSIEDIAQNGQNMGLEICVNTYPYALSQEEREELLLVLQTKLGTEVGMTAVFLSEEELTPEHCKKNYAAMVRYSFHRWLELHTEAWKTTKMPAVAFYAPMLYAKIPTAEELKELKEMKLEPFQATELACAPLFALRLLDANMFSIHNGIRARRGIPPPGSDAAGEPIKPPDSPDGRSAP